MNHYSPKAIAYTCVFYLMAVIVTWLITYFISPGQNFESIFQESLLFFTLGQVFQIRFFLEEEV